jgi:iron complex transport system substrate-binding protein
MGRDRIVADPLEPVRRAPDLIVGSWCGKKFRSAQVASRAGWHDVPAVRAERVHEIKSCDILQPGPAALTDGLQRLHALCAEAATGAPTAARPPTRSDRQRAGSEDPGTRV